MKKPIQNSDQVLQNKSSGQALVIILLVLVVILTVGLALVSRTVTDIKLSGQTEVSNRAFNAAEAGVESVLGGGSLNQSGVIVGEGTAQSKYTVQTNAVGGTNDAFVLNQPIAKDNTQQIWFMGHRSDGSLSDANCKDLDGTTPLKCFNSNKLTVYWGNPGQSASQTGAPGITPALEITIIYKNVSGTYQIAKGAYDPDGGRSNNFLGSVESVGNYVPPSNLAFKKDLDLCNAPFSLPCTGGVFSNGVTLYAARLRLLYNDEPQLLGAQPTNNVDTFPTQGKIISSSGTAGNVTRKVQVFESYPYLPGVFDYVLFNGSNNSISK